MSKDFSARTKSTQRSAATTAGWMNDAVHVSGVQDNYQVTPSGRYALQGFSVNISPASGVCILRCGSDIIAEFTVARDYKMPIYLYDALYFSSPDAATDVTFIISKG